MLPFVCVGRNPNGLFTLLILLIRLALGHPGLILTLFVHGLPTLSSLSSTTTPEQSTTLSSSHPPSPELPLAGSSVDQPASDLTSLGLPLAGQWEDAYICMKRGV